MKIALIGSNSKISRAIAGLLDHNLYRFLGLSRTDAVDRRISNRRSNSFTVVEIKEVLASSDNAIFTVGNTEAHYGLENLARLLLDNSYYAAMTVRAVFESHFPGNVVFFSTAHVYHLSTISRRSYAEEDLILHPRLQEWTKRTSLSIYRMALTHGDSATNEMEILGCIQRYLEENPVPTEILPVGTGYNYGYEISKLVVEDLVSGRPNHFTLRLSYGYGYKDKKNVIYQLLDRLFKGDKITLTSEDKDFVSYEDLAEVVKKICTARNDDQKIPEVLNVVSGDPISMPRLANYFQNISKNFNLTSNIERVRNKRNNIAFSSQRLESLLNNINYRSLVSFEDGLKEMLFRYVIEVRLRLEIVHKITGGSSAKVYLVKNEAGKEEIIKIAFENGAENGNLKLINEAKQLQLSRKALLGTAYQDTVPNVKTMYASSDFSYLIIEYLNYKNLSELVTASESEAEHCIKYLDLIINTLFSISSLDRIKMPPQFFENNYTNRARRRLQHISQMSKHFQNILVYESIHINNAAYKNPLNILSEWESDGTIDRFKSCYLGVCISGDPILDNIFVTEDQKIIMIDPRGDVHWDNETPMFDIAYEVGKLYFYFAGWKLIRLENFTLSSSASMIENGARFEIELTGELVDKFMKLQNALIPLLYRNQMVMEYVERDWMNDFRLQVLFSSAIHFLSDTYPRLVGQGDHKEDEALAEYLIGTIILNRVYEFIKLGKKHNDMEDINKVGMWQYCYQLSNI